MQDQRLLGCHISELDTPALLLDMAAAERNIAKMAAFFVDKPCKLRPHTKTHKLPLLAHAQLKAGAIGITCAKVEEAALFVESGIKSILIANQVVGQQKIRNLLNLLDRADVIVCLDSFENASALSEAAGGAGKRISFLVEVDTGLHRCGVPPLEATVEFLMQVAGLKHLCFRGLNGYEGSLFSEIPGQTEALCRQSNALLAETRAMVERAGFAVEVCSAGSSNTYAITGTCHGITDVQVGSYVTMDAHNTQYGVPFEQAVTVLASVISRPAPDRAITDAGKRSLSSDFGLPVCTSPGISLRALNDEHGILGIESSGGSPGLGAKLAFVPTHGCTTIPCFDEYALVRNERVEAIVPIVARGAVQ